MMSSRKVSFQYYPMSETRRAPVLCAEESLPEHPLLQDAVVAGAFTAEKLLREEGEVVLGYRVQIPAL
jgi:hypothetical protein